MACRDIQNMHADRAGVLSFKCRNNGKPMLTWRTAIIDSKSAYQLGYLTVLYHELPYPHVTGERGVNKVTRVQRSGGR